LISRKKEALVDPKRTPLILLTLIKELFMTHSSKTPSKQAIFLDLLGQPEGANLGQLMDATGWQAHSVRGFISGFIKKKRGLTIVSEKREGVRFYCLQTQNSEMQKEDAGDLAEAQAEEAESESEAEAEAEAQA
jgi:hypothetical protein